MKKETKHNIILWFALLLLLLILFSGCRAKTVYIPVETVRTEYKDRLSRDSIHLYDSIFVKMANDTVWMEKYKCLYRDRLVRDSVLVTDSVQVPYPVIEYREVNRLTSFQSFQIGCGRIFFIIILLLSFWLIVKKKFF